MELVGGRTVGPWVVEEELGRGAMAVVYRVRHQALGTRAALKVLGRIDGATEDRLLAEGRAQGAVSHPNVLGVLDHVTVDGHAALLLELVEGCDLATLLRDRPLALETSLDLFRQVVAGVAAAHAAGLVHRDLKASNVLVRRDGDRWLAKVGDFGLVKTRGADLTHTHAMLGTPRTMAPEQMRAARRVDERADVFALGCLLYELVCGRSPFPGEDLVDLYTAKLGGRYEDPASAVPDLPAPVVEAIRGCLQGVVARRIPSCAVLVEVLDGRPFTPSIADQTVDGLTGIGLCPGCGAAVDSEGACPSCGLPTLLQERYRLVELTGEEPFLQVFDGLDLKEGQRVTLRALDRSADDGARRRFGQGARSTFEEHGRRWRVGDEPVLPAVPAATRRHDPATVRRLFVAGGTTAALAGLGTLVTSFLTFPGGVPVLPECGGEPFAVEVRWAGPPTPLLARTCEGVEVVGQLDGTTTVTLPGVAVLDTPWGTSACAQGGVDCFQRPIRDGREPVTLKPVRDVTFTVVEGDHPLPGADIVPLAPLAFQKTDDRPRLRLHSRRLLAGDLAWRTSDEDGRVPVPDGVFQSLDLGVMVDGVARRIRMTLKEIEVAPTEDVLWLRVADERGAPVPHAQIQCIPDPPETVANGVADENGEVRCDFPTESTHRWVVVTAPGHHSGPMELQDLHAERITLKMHDADRVQVVCDGLPDGSCGDFVTAPTCGGAEQVGGTCRFEGRQLVCDCPAGSTELSHPFGTSPVVDGVVHVDRRGLSTIEVQIPTADVVRGGTCSLSLTARSGELRASGSPPTITFRGIPQGNWKLSGSCGTTRVSSTIVVDGADRIEVTPTLGAPR